MSGLLSSSVVRETYEDGLAALRKDFENSGNATAVVEGRSRVVDEVIVRCYQPLVEQASVPFSCVAIVALGGYGRSTLCPHSDFGLLLLSTDARAEARLDGG